MKILLKSIYVHEALPLARERGTVNGEVILDTGLSIEFKEDLLPEELEYIRDGLADLTQRVSERVRNAIRAIGEKGESNE
jgi:hypothetical protein